MKTAEILCAGERLHLFAERAVFWPKRKTLLISDPHFGKASAFRHAGVAVPEDVTAHDLQRLTALLGEVCAERLIILGDFLHARSGRSAATMEALERWCAQHSSLQTVLVTGNHDRLAGNPPACWNIHLAGAELREGPFAFCHEPQTIEKHYVMSGHIHPSICLNRDFGSSLRLPCFVFGETFAIFPAFGSFTGTHVMKPEKSARVFAIREGELMQIPSSLLK
ncbi:MAG: metallophosphoesterase [Verrucomicrobiales bacterium]|nr:metallophosphoesterase [Verrucomicrobiales bacterium]